MGYMDGLKGGMMSNLDKAKKILRQTGPYDVSQGIFLWVIAVILLAILKEVKESNDYSGGTPAGPGLGGC